MHHSNHDHQTRSHAAAASRMLPACRPADRSRGRGRRLRRLLLRAAQRARLARAYQEPMRVNNQVKRSSFTTTTTLVFIDRPVLGLGALLQSKRMGVQPTAMTIPRRTSREEEDRGDNTFSMSRPRAHRPSCQGGGGLFPHLPSWFACQKSRTERQCRYLLFASWTRISSCSAA